MNPELLKKLAEEAPLSPAEQAELDAALGGSAAISSAVRDLPTEEPSMVWRSELNEKLAAMGAPRKSKLAGFWWKLAAPVAATAIIGAAFFMNRPEVASSPAGIASASVEEEIWGTHLEMASAMDVAESYAPVRNGAETPTGEWIEWSSTDLESF